MLDIYANEELAMEAFKKNDPLGVVAALSKAIHINPDVVKVHDLLKPTIEERMKTHPEELDTVTSYVHLNLNSTTFPELIKKYLPKFPNDKYFLEMQIKSFVTLKKNFKALEVVNKALKLYPEDLGLLYLRAECLCMEDKPTEEALNALDKFLVSAPKDHEKVPACYYRKSRYFYVNKNIEKYFECFEVGLSAEKKQLSCFMPYSFPNKELLEKIFNHEKQKFLDAKQLTSSSGNSTIAQSLTLIKQNPQRKPFILKHREVFGFIADKILGTGYVTAFQLKDSPNIQTKLSKTLKNITLKDMDPTAEKIYDGFKMDVKIVDYGFLPGGIAAIIEDVNGDLQKIGIYNWPSKGAQVLDFINAVKTFRPNVKLTIINPYMRMAISGTSMIRVDNPEFLKLGKLLLFIMSLCLG
uniref:Tetratricopeptide repeat protein n=1 Tax=Panagrolaimus davidi TaxID=227884 RepID=A0A914Q0R7_9BILA